MEKLTVTNSFNKSIELLRTTDCSPKEKLHHFNNISECLTNAHLQSNYQQFISPAISTLILFCEDGVDSTIRMCAYENLIKMLRICEAGQQIRKVLIDLYHEIKKNGNERSLRICLNLFGYLIHHITQKRSRVYVQNVLPCLHVICGRRETMLLEALTDFFHPFCGHLSLNMSESEVMRLIDVFLANLTVGCATKRRCMAQNTMTVLEHHRKRHNMAVYTLNRSTEVLVKNRDEVNTTLGVLGLWRLLVPLCLDELEETNSQVQEKLLEIFDLSIQYLLSCPNHSVINATLEVLIALTHNMDRLPNWRRRLCDDPNDILSKRNSLKMVVCGKETQLISAEDTVIVSMDNSDQLTLEMIETTTGTDSISESDLMMNPENISLRSLKSTDSSIGGFFNSLIPSTTEFFRNQNIFPSSSQSDSLQSTPKTTPVHQLNVVPPSPSQEAEILNFTPASSKSIKSEWCAMEFKDCPVFGISDLSEQSILSYATRVLCSKYLLTGKSKQLIPDVEIRVSIKHLSLLVLANILSVVPELFLQPLNLSAETESLDIDCDRKQQQGDGLQEFKGHEEEGTKEEHLLDIKEDHFGPSSTTMVDYLTPLSRSMDGSSPSEQFSVDPRMTHSDVIVSQGSQIRLRVKRIKQFRESEQFIYEILLLKGHSDPMLRSDVIFVVQNFFKGISAAYLTFDGFVQKWKIPGRSAEFLTLEFLYDVVVQGLQDEHHAVVKHALSAIHIAINFSISHCPIEFRTSSMTGLISETFNVAEGKPYWVTKSHLTEIVPKFDFDLIGKACSDQEAIECKERAYAMLRNFLRDEDQRIRHAAAKGFIELLRVGAKEEDEAEIIREYISEKVFSSLAVPLNKLQERRNSFPEDDLRRLLFDLSNQLLDVGNKNTLSGIICSLRMIMDCVPPVQNYSLWATFNFLSILESFLKDNSLVIFDNANHAETLKLYCELLAGKAAHETVSNEELQFLLEHSLQMMNIFGHIVNNYKPLVTHMTTKADLFTSDRELQKMQQKGFFGNKAVYLKVYKLIKVIYDTYKMDINAEVEEKLRNLLRTVMASMSLVLELKPVTSISQSMKLVEEILSYLNVLFVWEPVTVIYLFKYLFKYFFERNFVSRREDYEFFLKHYRTQTVQEVVRKISEFSVMKPGEFYQEEESHIKLFEPIVIKSLRIYMKLEPKDQSSILEFICQLLTLNVNYAMLDSNLEFFKFVQEQLDTIEGGRVKDSEKLIENMIRFLFLLNNKKLINNPKIIHITDNLLANQNIRECSLRALIQLSDELFFNREAMEAEGQGEVMSVTSAELNTEKEFIFSILMKFLNFKVIQRNVYLILCAHKEVMEYRESTLEGILGMIERFQLEGEVIEMENVTDLVKLSAEKELLEKVEWERMKKIMQKLSFGRDHFITEWRVFSILSQGLILKRGKDEGNWNDFLADKWIELNRNLIQIIKESTGQEDLLIFYKENRWSVDEMGDSLKSLVKERGKELFSVENLMKLRFKNVELFLGLVEEWIEIGFIRDYSTVIVDLDNSTDADRMLTKELIKRCLVVLDKDSSQIESYRKVFIEKKELIVEIIGEDSIKFDNCKELILDTIETFCRSQIRVSMDKEMTILKTLEDLSKDQTFHVQIVKILLNYFINSPKAFVKKRSRDLVLQIRNESKAEENSLLESIPELNQFKWFSSNDLTDLPSLISDYLSEKVDEPWIWSQIKSNLSHPRHSRVQLEILLTMKSDIKVSNILSEMQLTNSFISDVIHCSFRFMIASFQKDSITYNPHVNYLKVPFVLKFSLEKFFEKYSSEEYLISLREFPSEELKWTTRILIDLLRECAELEKVALRSIELRSWDKFVADNLLKNSTIELIIEHIFILVTELLNTFVFDDQEQLEEGLKFIQLALENNSIFRTWNRPEGYGKHFDKFIALISFIHSTVHVRLKHSPWLRDYKGIEGFFDESESDPQLLDLYKKVSYLIKLREEISSKKYASVDMSLRRISRIVHHIVRFNQIYPMAVIPHKYLRTVCDNLKLSDRLKCPVPLMSIGDLKDSDTLKDFVANVKDIGFTSRQQFEEYLMTLLVLLNTEFDESEYDSQEQYVIRKTCFASITELLVTIKEFPRIGSSTRTFVHTTRNDTIPIYMIHLKKLKELLNVIPGCDAFESSNLERDATNPWNYHSLTEAFKEGQFNLPTIWDALEDEKPVGSERDSPSAGEKSLCLKNCAYNLEWFEIDYNSSVKMVLEMSTQMYEQYGKSYLSFFLPCMVRLTDLFVTRDQYKWLKEIVYKLHEMIPHEDANCHQYIVYLMCKTNAVLVPSTSDVNQLTQTVLPGYLKSKSQGIVIGALKGILVLFESCVLHNSSIGGLNDEIQQLRRLILGYVDKCLNQEQNAGVAEGDAYEEHARLLWTIVFYALEKTVKFVPECPLMSRVVVYLNRTLRSTNNLQLFGCLINGTGRLILTNCISSVDLEKIERIAMDLVKKGNELFAMPALRLLITCIYIGSVDQLEKTQRSNGVVQDDPETTLRLMEKVDVLFAKIKVSPPDVAQVYGQVLSQIIRDVIPSKDVLTKVIKEMIISQPHIQVVAQILHQVFRSSIDAAYLPLLQEWLVSSLNNFLVLPQPKAIWSLTVIFVSASLNVHLLKIFKHVLNMGGDQRGMGNSIDPVLVHYFAVATKDFYEKLTKGQKQEIVNSFSNSPHDLIKSIGRNLLQIN